eukprot:14555-Heterococcus_DN1.PRE.1
MGFHIYSTDDHSQPRAGDPSLTCSSSRNVRLVLKVAIIHKLVATAQRPTCNRHFISLAMRLQVVGGYCHKLLTE